MDSGFSNLHAIRAMSIPEAPSPNERMYHDDASSEEPLLNEEKQVWRTERTQRFRKPLFWAFACLVILAFGTGITALAAPASWKKHLLQDNTHPPSPVSEICSQPRLRKEWRSLSAEEQQAYIKAVQCLSSIPSQHIPNGTLHDDFAYSHNIYGETSHNSASFLPWHRYFIYHYEKTLQSRCQYSGSLPYWDWIQDWKDPLQSPIWDPVTGFGGNGNTSTPRTVGFGHCLQEGPFAYLQVQHFGADQTPHCLSRGFLLPRLRPHFGAQVINATAMESVMALDDFFEFTMKLEEGPHLSLPRLIQGDWRKNTAPNDPVFFLHHAQLDRLWWQWQLRDGARFTYAYNGPAVSNTTTEGVLTDEIDLAMMVTPDLRLPSMTVEHLMAVDRGLLCYDYEPPS